jgi:protein-S-isoprenylcysteine O-methyltransferase Ste14
MRRPAAAAVTVGWFVLVPCVFGAIVPWWLTEWQAGQPPYWVPLRVLGAVLVCLGAIVLVQAFTRFVIEGAGTPVPIAPTERLVVGGLYRYVRNPIYLAGLAVVVGQGLLLSRAVLFVYAAVVALGFVGLVHGYEEPALKRRYGEEYEAYRRAVPAWWPRIPNHLARRFHVVRS